MARFFSVAQRPRSFLSFSTIYLRVLGTYGAFNFGLGKRAFGSLVGGRIARGRWDAVVVANDVEVPLPFEIEVEGDSVNGSFFNGDRRITSTRGELSGDVLTLWFDQYAASHGIDGFVAAPELLGSRAKRRC